MNLYEINNDLQNALLNLTDEDGVIVEGMEDQIDSLFSAKNDKLLNCAKYIKQQIANINMLKAEEDALKARRKSLENRSKWLMEYVRNNMELGESAEDAQVKITTRKTASVNIVDFDSLPTEFVKVIPEEYKADKMAIKKAFKSGEVTGAELTESFSVGIK